MTPELFKSISLNLGKHEGRKIEMYRDTKGIVTCGVGHALFAAVDATRIQWYKVGGAQQKGIIATSAGVLATRDEIIAKWSAVRQNVPCFSLMLTYDETDLILENDLIKFEKVVRETFPEVDSYPESVQVALYDIAFNCGSFSKWPNFKSAVSAKQWSDAATESFRPDVSKERNEETRRQLAIVV